MQTDSLLGKKFVGTDELRRKLTKILNLLPKEGVIIVTQHGKPKAALIDIWKYQKIQEYILRRTTQTYR